MEAASNGGMHSEQNPKNLGEILPLQAPSGWQLNRAKDRAVRPPAIRMAFPITRRPAKH